MKRKDIVVMCEEEYKEVSENLRHFGNMRFAEMTVFIAVTGALVAFVFNADFKAAPHLKRAAILIGMFLSLCFLVMEERASDYWHHFKRRAVVLESQMNVKIYSTVKSNKILTATNATRALYFLAIAFWIATLLSPP